MERMAVTSGTAMTRFVENNVALRAAENAGLPPAEQDWAPVQAFISGAARIPGYAGSSWLMLPARFVAPVTRRSSPAAMPPRPASRSSRKTASSASRGRTTAISASFEPIRYAGRPFGTVDIVIDSAELEGAASNSRNLLIALGLALIAVVLALAYAIGRSIAKPVARLRRALADAAAGNRSFRISHTRTDSFGALFDAFNDLAEKLDGQPEDIGDRPAALEETRVTPSPMIDARLERLRRRA